MASYKDEQGVWVLYDYEAGFGPHALAIFEDVVPAAREHARQGYGKVGFWPFDVTLKDAVIEWEKRDVAKVPDFPEWMGVQTIVANLLGRIVKEGWTSSDEEVAAHITNEIVTYYRVEKK